MNILESRVYDKTGDFNENIKPHLEAILKACNAYNIPFIAAFAVADDGSETNYVSQCLTPAFFGIELSEDRFALLGKTLHSEDVENTVNTVPKWVKQNDQ